MNKWARPFEWNRGAASLAAGRLAPPAQQYFAFLSYSHQDSADADWLHKELERFQVPSSLTGRLTANGVIPARLTPIFRDRHELAAAGDLGTEIREALEASHCLIVLCSPAAATSHWTNAEVELFKRLHPDGCVIAAIVRGEPFASDIKGREAEECLPPALRQKYDRRGRPTAKRAEPLAADLRESGDGRRLGFLKVVAGMLGVGLDELVQRDQLRRQRRLAGIAISSLIGMVVAGGLAVTAIDARDAARDQRREAESLVEFMVGDLREKLEPIGKLDALDGVGSKVLEYYSKQDTSELSDSGLMQRSRALNLMADVAYQGGKLEEAEALYRQAMAGTAEVARRAPDDPKRVFDHAQNVFFVGEVARYRGDPDAAAAGYSEYRRLAYRLAAMEPDNLLYRMEVLYGDENVGISLFNKRKYSEAGQKFAAVIGPMERLASLYPDKLTYQKEVATAYGWLAEAQRAQGQYDAAIATRRQQLALVDRLLLDQPTDVQLRRHAVIAHLALGILLSERGSWNDGLRELRAAITDADRLIEIEPKNAFWNTLAAMIRLEFGKQLLAAGQRDEATAQADRGCELAAGLKASGAGFMRARVAQTDCLIMRSRIAIGSGAIQVAADTATRAVASARSERNEDPVTDRYRVAAAQLILGDVRQRKGDASGARAAWSAGLAGLPGSVAERPADMHTRAELLQRLGRDAEARSLAKRLTAMGYRSAAWTGE